MVTTVFSQLAADGGKLDLPWSFDSCTPDLLHELGETLTGWVLDYNDSLVTQVKHLIPECWPMHPGLAREIAAIYSHWMRAFHSTHAVPYDATAFFERTLPGFQSRITGWLGPESDACLAGNHRAEWDKAVRGHIARVAEQQTRTAAALDGSRLAALAETRSAPPAQVEAADDPAVDLSTGEVMTPAAGEAHWLDA